MNRILKGIPFLITSNQLLILKTNIESNLKHLPISRTRQQLQHNHPLILQPILLSNTVAPGFSWRKSNQEQKRWRTSCLSTIQWSSFSPTISSSTWPISRSYLPEMPSRWTRFPSLALRMSCRWHHKTTSVWEPQSGLPLDLGMWWGTQEIHWSTLTPNQVSSLWLTRKHTAAPNTDH